MLMLIMGAGASFDSVYPDDLPVDSFATIDRNTLVTPRDSKHPDRPPLASGLVDLRQRFGVAADAYPEVRPLIARLRRTFEAGDPVNIESELDAIVGLAERTDPHLLRQLAAFRFYLREIITETCDAWWQHAHGITNYHVLIERVESWRYPREERVCVVTFNYDTLLERAVADVLNLKISGLSDYIGPNDWKWTIVKLHGSVNWGRIVSPNNRTLGKTGTEVERALIEYAAEIRPADEYVWLDKGEGVIEDARVLLPALAIPTTVKPSFECPREHLERLRMLLPEVDRVLVIGWRATEAHFLALWQGVVSHAVTGFIVNGSSEEATQTAQRLAAGTGLPHDRIVGTGLGFSTLLNRKKDADGELTLSELLG